MRTLKSNWLLNAVLCLVLLFKMAVPAGFMPDMDALQHGVYKITICSADGAKNIWVGKGQKPIQDQNTPAHKNGKSTYCPFAGIHALGVPIIAAMFALLLVWRRVRFSFPIAPSGAIYAVVAWPRAPPVSLA